MHSQGHFFPNATGGEDYLSLTGNGDSIMNYRDPLVHVGEYQMHPFNVKAYK